MYEEGTQPGAFTGADELPGLLLGQDLHLRLFYPEPFDRFHRVVAQDPILACLLKGHVQNDIEFVLNSLPAGSFFNHVIQLG